MPLPDQILGPWLSLFPPHTAVCTFWYISFLGTHLAKGTSQVLSLGDTHLSCFSLFFCIPRQRSFPHWELFILPKHYFLSICLFHNLSLFFVSSMSLQDNFTIHVAGMALLTVCPACAFCLLNWNIQFTPYEGRVFFHPAHHTCASTWYCAGKMVAV